MRAHTAHRHQNSKKASIMAHQGKCHHRQAFLLTLRAEGYHCITKTKTFCKGWKIISQAHYISSAVIFTFPCFISPSTLHMFKNFPSFTNSVENCWVSPVTNSRVWVSWFHCETSFRIHELYCGPRIPILGPGVPQSTVGNAGYFTFIDGNAARLNVEGQ